MNEADRNIIRSVRLALLSWGKDNPWDAELVSKGSAILGRISECDAEEKMGDVKEILVYTREECDALCAILCRNGYCVTARLNKSDSTSEIGGWVVSYRMERGLR